MYILIQQRVFKKSVFFSKRVFDKDSNGCISVGNDSDSEPIQIIFELFIQIDQK